MGYGDLIEPVSKLNEVINLLEGLEYEVHTMADDGYDYLSAESHRCIHLKNKAGKELFIGFEDEFSLFFDAWHTHYFGYEKSILNNTAYPIIVRCKGKCMGSMLIRNEVLSKETAKGKVISLLHAPEFINRMNEDGIVVSLVFWNSDLDSEIIFEPGEFNEQADNEKSVNRMDINEPVMDTDDSLNMVDNK